jgi:hypothetical protein
MLPPRPATAAGAAPVRHRFDVRFMIGSKLGTGSDDDPA